MTHRLAIVVSHPIQHFAAFYRGLAAHPDVDLTVLFGASIGARAYFDREMNTEIKWATDLLGGYRHEFLAEAAGIREASPLTLNNPSVWAALGRLRPDVVLLYGYNTVTSMRALTWCRTKGVPAMLISDSERRTPRGLAVRTAKAAALPLLYRQFACFLSVGDCNDDHYRAYGVTDELLFRCPFTIDEDTYREAAAHRDALRAHFRAEHAIPQDAVLTLTVGKVNERKRTRDVVDAARHIKTAQSGPTPILMMVAGNGVLLDALKATAATQDLPVRFLGFVNVDALPAAYAAADIVVHPSGRDPHPLVMSEAACIGLPLVVSSHVGAVGPTDIAREGVNATVFPCGDTVALARAVLALAGDWARRQAMSAASRACFDDLDLRRSVDGAVEAMRFATDWRSRSGSRCSAAPSREARR